jgi:predicted N-acyltransferase
LFLEISSFLTTWRTRERGGWLQLRNAILSFSVKFAASDPRRLFERISCEPPTNKVVDAPYSVKIHESIMEIDPSIWDSIIGTNSLVRSHAYLAAIESSAINDCKHFYPVISNASGIVVAHASVYTITTDFAQLLPSSLRSVCRIVRRRWTRFLQIKITECASPLSASHGISFSADEAQIMLIGEISSAIEAVARSENSPLIVIRDFLTSERERFDGLLATGYNLVSNMPLARIRIRWRSYDEYLASMRARYRKDVKRRLISADRRGQKVTTIASFGCDAALWVRQVRTVFEQTKGFKREVISSDYYEHMDRKLGDKSVLVAAERDGRFVAHGMVLHDDTSTIATYFGRDPGAASQEWFQLVNEVIRIGIDKESEFINLGLGSYDAKTNVGADIEPLYVYSKSTFVVVNWLMRIFRGTMEYPINDKKRVFHD